MKVKHPNLIKLGDKIRELRISKGYSQESIADAAGMGRTYMGRVERGEQNIPVIFQNACIVQKKGSCYAT
ncbi:TPA: helix-turn-helix domain-containing protein [Legionella pneumophila subsp. pneumophila]|nr:helix-turn-helix domain-containing protein [Legionella pneumophila subsp. pneumophila]